MDTIHIFHRKDVLFIAVEIKEILHPAYGTCVKITNGIIEVLVSVELGPRILSYGFCEKENIFFEEKTLFTNEQEKFFPYGGHRLAVAPEGPDSYYPENSSVIYTLLPDGVEFTPPRRKERELQTAMQLILHEKTSDIMLVHTLKNCSKERIYAGIWAITMLQPDGFAILPQNINPADETLPSRLLAFWPGSSPKDHRMHLSENDQYITIEAIRENRPLTFGINDVSGWAAYVWKENVLLQRFVHSPDVLYPNHGCSFRASLDQACFQLESFSPLYWVEPGCTIRHVENFSLFHSHASGILTLDADIHAFLEGLK